MTDKEKLNAMYKEDETVSALGITMYEPESPGLKKLDDSDEYVVIPDPHADDCDFSELRGTKAPNTAHEAMSKCSQYIKCTMRNRSFLPSFLPYLKTSSNSH
jgi:hypothetical protein